MLNSYLNIGFLFLAYIPLSILVLFYTRKISKTGITLNNTNDSKERKNKKNSNKILSFIQRIISSDKKNGYDNSPEKGLGFFYEVLILGLIFWLGWLFSCSGIIWYGLTGFIFLLLILVETYHYIRFNFSWPTVLLSYIVTVTWLIMALFLKFSYLPQYNIMTSPDNLKFARGEVKGDDVTRGLFGRYVSVIDNINKDINSHPENPPKIYRVGTFYKYFITKNDETVLDDQLLDKFAYAYQDKDDKKLLERFRNMGIKYIIFDVSLKNVDRSPEQNLKKKYEEFKNFVNNNSSNFVLLSDFYDEQTIILRIY